MTTTATAAGPTPALLSAINAAFNSRDVDRIMEFFADDCTFLMARGPEPDGRRVHGKAAVRKCARRSLQGHPRHALGSRRADHRRVARGHRVDGHRARATTASASTTVGAIIYEFRGDKILNKDTYWKRVEQAERL